MRPTASSRRITTVLFLDIVGSTRVAADLGDVRWRNLLAKFRRIVRRELRRHGGHEEGTAGDGFLATFREPAAGIRAAPAIVSAVHDVGIEIRCGLHTGECEVIEGQVGGIAVHIASRVMALAAAAEILVTSTVKDLVVGSPLHFRDHSEQELRGVPGRWRVHSLVDVDGRPVPRPLDPDSAATRAGDAASSPLLRRRVPLALTAAAFLAAVAVLSTALLRGPPPPTPKQPTPASVLRIDPAANRIVRVVRDEYRSTHLPHALRSLNGVLWQETPGFLVQRDMRSGSPRNVIETEAQPRATAVGFGALWVARSGDVGKTAIDRVDLIAGRVLGTIEIPGSIAAMEAGDDAVWTINFQGLLREIDPVRNRVVASYETPALSPATIAAQGDTVWICDCPNGVVIQFDRRRGRVRRTIDLPQQGFLVGIDSSEGTTAWLLDPVGSTLTPIDATTGETGQPIGFEAVLYDGTIAFGSLWLAAGTHVHRFDLSTRERTTIRMPRGVSAGSIAPDADTGALWVANCSCPSAG